MTSTNTPLQSLAAISPLRVWSVLITIFGDAVAPRGGSVPAVVLQAILERLDIKPEAMRVALHRLVKDGWIDRAKVGRQSHYRLTARGEDEFLAASKRIYAKEPDLRDPWKIAVLPPMSEAERERQYTKLVAFGYWQISPYLYLGHSTCAGAEAPSFAISGTVDHLPEWVQLAVSSSAVCEEYEKLEAALCGVLDLTFEGPEQAAAARILIVHQWRRILLRHPDLPEAWMSDRWRGEACRSLVLGLHLELSKRVDPWLDEVIGSRNVTEHGES